MLGLAKRLAALGGAIGVLVAASGCMRLDFELEVRSDDSVGGSFTAAWSEEFLDEVDSGANALSRADLNRFLEALMEGAPDGQRSRYDEDGFVGRTATFTDRPLTEFAEFGDRQWGYLRITHEDREYRLKGRWDLRATGFLDPKLFEDAEILVTVSFPAKVTDHNGELDGRAVTWRMRPGENYTLHAEAVQYNGWAWFWVGVAALAVVLALLWIWQALRLRRYSVGTRR